MMTVLSAAAQVLGKCPARESSGRSFRSALQQLFAALTAAAPVSKEPEAAPSALSCRTDVTLALELYGNAILRTAYSYLHSRADAEDVVQDTLIQLMKTDPAFESPAHEKAWLLRVAINLCKNRLRSPWRSRTQELTEEYPCDDLSEELSFVWDAVRDLPEKYREVVHLFYQEGYSTAEIAALLKKNESTVRSLLHRARALLKETLKEAYDFE